MSFTVYGLRLKGDKEVRYIGQTNGPIEVRLHWHRTYRPPTLRSWLATNAGNIEAFAIGATDTREEATAMEKAIIALCLRLDHRLLNRRSLPAEFYPLEQWGKAA